MQKKFVSNLLLMVLLNLLVKPIAIFGVDAAVQNRVGAEEYGIYFALLNFSFLFNIFLDFGLNNYTTKHVSQYPNLALKYLGKVMGFRFLLFFLYAIITFGIGLLLDYDQRELSLLSIFVINQFIVTIISYIRGHLGGFMLFRSEAIIGVLDRFLLIVFCFYALYYQQNSNITIEWFVWMQLICYSITLVVGFILLFRKIGMPKISFNPKVSMVIIRNSFPYALLILLMMVYTRTDSVMLEQMHEHGEKEAGIYAQGFRLINALFLFAMLFSNLLFPMFSRMIGKKEDVVPLLRLSSKLLIGGATGLAILVYFNSEFILKLIYTHNVYHSSEPFKLLMISFIGMCISIVYGTLLTAAGNLRMLNVVSLVGIFINVGLNLWLIPLNGAYGAAMATVITQLLVSIVQFIYVHRIYKMSILNSQLYFFPAYIITYCILCFFLPAHTIGILLLLSLMIPVGMILFQLIDINGLKGILKQADK